MNSSVAFVIPYTGRWPRWAPLFFSGVKRNPDIQVILVCERLPPFPLPANVTACQFSKEELSERFRRVTGLPLGTISGHKLCDFKPFYGLAFSDMLAEYQFWGYCDIDLVFGDLSKLLTTDLLANCDCFSAHDAQIVGHFTVIRNTHEMNNAGFRIENWASYCMAPTACQLDEQMFSDTLARMPGVRWLRTEKIEDELKRPFCRFGITFGYRGEVAYLETRRPGIVTADANQVIYEDADHFSEVLYVHFMGTKRWWHWLFYQPGHDPHRFSRIGYGGPRTSAELGSLYWRLVWLVQIAFAEVKSTVGALLKAVLPLRLFLQVRRGVLGRSRY